MSDQPQILFEDNHVIVALKEPNMLVQGDATHDADMLSLLKAYVKEKYKKPGEAYLGLIHRMDRPVGGLLVFARTSKAAARLSAQLREKLLDREYVCLVSGNPPDSFTLRHFLDKDEKTNMVKAIPSYLNLGKEAILHAKTIVRKESGALVCVRLETGRAHQIRVQMKESGFPLLGDRRYGISKGNEQIALWGMRLAFHHPITGQSMVFISAPPQSGRWTDFRREIEGLINLWPAISAQLPFE